MLSKICRLASMISHDSALRKVPANGVFGLSCMCVLTCVGMTSEENYHSPRRSPQPFRHRPHPVRCFRFRYPTHVILASSLCGAPAADQLVSRNSDANSGYTRFRLATCRFPIVPSSAACTEKREARCGCGGWRRIDRRSHHGAARNARAEQLLLHAYEKHIYPHPRRPGSEGYIIQGPALWTRLRPSPARSYETQRCSEINPSRSACACWNNSHPINAAVWLRRPLLQLCCSVGGDGEP